MNNKRFRLIDKLNIVGYEAWGGSCWEYSGNGFVWVGNPEGFEHTQKDLGTGITDREGHYLYENDLVVCNDKLYRITWDEGGAGLVLLGEKGLLDIKGRELIYVGNIWENPAKAGRLLGTGPKNDAKEWYCRECEESASEGKHICRKDYNRVVNNKDWEERFGEFADDCMIGETDDERNIYLSGILGLDELKDFIEQEIERAYSEGWGDCERFHTLREKEEEDILTEKEITELDLLSEKLNKLNKEKDE